MPGYKEYNDAAKKNWNQIVRSTKSTMDQHFLLVFEEYITKDENAANDIKVINNESAAPADKRAAQLRLANAYNYFLNDIYNDKKTVPELIDSIKFCSDKIHEYVKGIDNIDLSKKPNRQEVLDAIEAVKYARNADRRGNPHANIYDVLNKEKESYLKTIELQLYLYNTATTDDEKILACQELNNSYQNLSSNAKSFITLNKINKGDAELVKEYYSLVNEYDSKAANYVQEANEIEQKTKESASASTSTSILNFYKREENQSTTGHQMQSLKNPTTFNEILDEFKKRVNNIVGPKMASYQQRGKTHEPKYHAMNDIRKLSYNTKGEDLISTLVDMERYLSSTNSPNVAALKGDITLMGKTLYSGETKTYKALVEATSDLREMLTDAHLIDKNTCPPNTAFEAIKQEMSITTSSSSSSSKPSVL